MTHLAIIRETIEDRDIATYAHLDEFGFDSRVICSRDEGVYDRTGLGLPVTRLRRLRSFAGPRPVAHRATRFAASHSDLDALLGFKRAVRNCDLLCVNDTHLATSAQAARLRSRSSTTRLVVVCAENVPFARESSDLSRRRKECVREHADLFVAISPRAAEALRLEGVDEHRVVTQPLGIELHRFDPAHRNDGLRAQWGAQEDDVVVCFAGRLLREKGLIHLLLALERLGTRSVRLVIVGEGVEEPRVRGAMRALGVEGAVTFVPWVPWTQVPAILASADVFAMPSLTTPYWEEQLSYALIEAMASGVPILSTRSGAIPFVVGDAGVLVEPYDVGMLTDALGSLCADATLRSAYAAAGRKRAAELFDNVTVARNLAAHFSSLW